MPLPERPPCEPSSSPWSEVKIDDGLVGEAEPVELIEDLDDLLVDVADAVEVVVLALAHPPLVVGDQPGQVAVGLVIDAVRGHAARRIERLLPGVLHGNTVPFALVERVGGHTGDLELGVLGLHRLAGQVGVEPHHVVRIDEVDREVPGLLAVGHRPALGFQPLHGLRRGDGIVLVAAQRAFDVIAGAGVVVEAVVLVHHRFEQRLDVVGLVLDGHRGIEMPLALVGGVVAELAQDLADGRQPGIQALHVGHAGIVEDAVMRHVQAGIDHRARGRAHVGRDVMVLEEGAGAAQALVAGHREGPRVAHVLFLVGQDEQDVVAAVARARRIGGGEARFAAAGDGGRLGDRGIGRHGGAGQRGAGLEERPARRCWTCSSGKVPRYARDDRGRSVGTACHPEGGARGTFRAATPLAASHRIDVLDLARQRHRLPGLAGVLGAEHLAVVAGADIDLARDRCGAGRST